MVEEVERFDVESSESSVGPAAPDFPKHKLRQGPTVASCSRLGLTGCRLTDCRPGLSEVGPCRGHADATGKLSSNSRKIL